MRILLRLITLLCMFLLVAPAVSQDDIVGFAIRQTFVQCAANKFRGTREAPVRTTDAKVELKCGEFWKSLYDDHEASPFSMLVPGQKPEEIPFSVWRPAIEDALQITPEPK